MWYTVLMKTQETKPKWLYTGRDMVRERVRVRDKHTCQDCRKRWNGISRRFDVHHLKGMCGKKSRGYDKLSEMKGLTTLCHSCHMLKHRGRQTGKAVLPNHRNKVKSLRKKGITYDAIGKKYGVSSQAVYYFINGGRK